MDPECQKLALASWGIPIALNILIYVGFSVPALSTIRSITCFLLLLEGNKIVTYFLRTHVREEKVRVNLYGCQHFVSFIKSEANVYR